MRLEIPLSVTKIESSAFRGCTRLTQLQIPSSIQCLGHDVFEGVRQLERLTLLGFSVSPEVESSLSLCLAPTAEVIGRALRGGKFGHRAIVA
jgi:hypothetical protein